MARVGRVLGDVARCGYNVVEAVAAFVWRTLLFRTTFVAISGSFGKTTAKDCLHAILSLEGRTVATPRSNNTRGGVLGAILRARPWTRFVVIEVAIDRPGMMRRQAFLIRPDVAVITAVGRAHTSKLLTLEQTAHEKSQLLAFLGKRGVAVLNGDDPLVSAMGDRLRCRVVKYGLGAGHEVRASEASSNWPERLGFVASTPTESRPIQTQLVGIHWLPSALGAIAAAHVCGVSLAKAEEALLTVHPYSARLQPAPLPSGAVMLRDETNGTLQSLDAAFEVMRNAAATRKMLVISDCSDFPKNDQKRQRYFAHFAAEALDAVVFVGERGHYGVKYAKSAGMDPKNVHAFLTLEAASDFLRADLRAGDLVLLRGRTTDHLSRLYHAQFGPIQCWKQRCKRLGICDTCPELGATGRREETAPAEQPEGALVPPPAWTASRRRTDEAA
ncbi:MAG: UDP-N-acetylmuramoyl-tripeptide--D-alanyl-D-alanine ligase [Bryobacteraceae bacterium]|nr:UDP-N-acetylmuramoyl-tripeptide--D-alanyl-D-alanine ligase [Bryobacteraceae bacterium]